MEVVFVDSETRTKQKHMYPQEMNFLLGEIDDNIIATVIIGMTVYHNDACCRHLSINNREENV